MTEEVYETTVRFLQPQEVRFSRTTQGRVSLQLDGETIEPVRLTRSFPHTAPEELISVTKEDGKEIGVIEHLKDLDRSTRQLVEEELELSYFSPVISKINKVVQHYGASSWHVDTDRGPQVVRVRERGDIRWISSGKAVITDVHGVRYELPDVSTLDEQSRSLLEQEA